MPSDETMVSDLILANGMRKVDIIRFARPVDVDAWVEKLVPDHSMDTWSYVEWVEDPKGLKLNHLYLLWKSRGPVSFRKFKADLLNDPVHNQVEVPDRGILWWIAPGESLSFSTDVAATLHKRVYGVMPSAAWVRNLPAGANTSRTERSGAQRPRDIEVGEGDDQGLLALKVGDWVPERFVVVGNPRMEN